MSVMVHSTAHPNVLSLPKQFSKLGVDMISFIDTDESFISLKPLQKWVAAYLWHGSSVTQGIPTNYEQYVLEIVEDGKVPKTDIDNIFKWTNAKRLEIYGDNDVAIQLQQRISELGNLRRLKELVIDVSYDTSMQLRIQPFADSPLKQITFTANSLGKLQFGMYVQSLAVPNGWACTDNTVVLNKFVCKKLI